MISITARRSWIGWLVIVLLAAPGPAALLSTAFLATALGQQKEETPLERQLRAVLAQQAEDWNRGDIEAFMQAYWKDEKLTFSSGGRTARGWNAARDRYLKGYPDRATMGKLTFSQLEVFPLGEESALMLGRWKLDRTEPAGGNFSLVWRRTGGKWLIIHDHTSEGGEPEGAEPKE